MGTQARSASAAGAVVEEAVQNAAKRADVPLGPDTADTNIIAEAAGQEAKGKVAKIIAYATNREAWYMSDVTRGSIGTIGASIGGIGTLFFTDTLSMATAWPLILTMSGAAWALYGRWVATKPIGS